MSEPTPLWTGDQVMAYTMTITNDPGKRALARRVALELVHQYEAERTKDKQRIQELEAELALTRDAWRISDANLTGDLEMSAERIRKLEAELARLREQGQWEPLTVGTLSIDNATMAVGNDTLSVIYDAGDDVRVMTWDLPASIRLCRKVDAQPKEGNNHE